jgi:hypothetical protein
VTWSVDANAAANGITINGFGFISIAQNRIFNQTRFTVTATNSAGSGSNTIDVAANIKPVLSGSTIFNVNTYNATPTLFTISQTGGGTVTWSRSATPDYMKTPIVYDMAGVIVYAGQSSLQVQTQNDTTFSMVAASNQIYDSGTQGIGGSITVTATNIAGSATFTVNGYAYPYVIRNWTSAIGPDQAFEMYWPYKDTGNQKYGYVYSNYYGVGTGGPQYELVYNYYTRKITTPTRPGTELRPYQYARTAWEGVDDKSYHQWYYVFPDEARADTGWWYNGSDGTGWRLNGGLSGGGNTQMWPGGPGGNAQIQNLVP